MREGDPKGSFFHVFDKTKDNRFLISKKGWKDMIPDSDAPTGMDLVLQDANGNERVIAEKALRAKFSPDGTKIAYTTSDAVLHVEDLSGGKVKEVTHSYDPSWRPDSKAVAFSQGPEGSDPSFPGTLKLSELDLETGEVQNLTDGSSDDVRPHYTPCSDKCIVFVNGGRTGLASFWILCKGSEPQQLTNVGMQDVNEKFVPTPYMRSGWSPDGRWFVYDFKQGQREETWALEFNSDCTQVVQAKKIGEGIDPRWKDDGKTLTALQHDGERVKSVEYTLP